LDCAFDNPFNFKFEMITKDEYLKALEIVKEYHGQLSDNYTTHFIEWRDRFFDVNIQLTEWKSKHNNTLLSTDVLHERYSRAMNTSPFNQPQP